MEWSKVKNCMIVILLFANVFLLVLVSLREGGSARYQEELEGVAAALGKNGISVTLEGLPRTMTIPPAAVARSRDGEQAMAEALLGSVERLDTGGSVRVVYTSAQGTASFSSDGRFDFELSPQVRPLDGADPAGDGAACLERLGLQATLARAQEEDGETRLSYRQSWEGAPIFSSQITLTYREGSLRSISGERLSGVPAVSSGDALLSVPTVLLRFLAGINEGGYVCNRIDRMTQGYLSNSGAARLVVQLSPVWYIETDTGAYYVDGVTGALTKADG